MKKPRKRKALLRRRAMLDSLKSHPAIKPMNIYRFSLLDGVIGGFRSPGRVFVRRDYRDVLTNAGTVNRAWLDVAALLSDAIEMEGAAIGKKATAGSAETRAREGIRYDGKAVAS